MEYVHGLADWTPKHEFKVVTPSKVRLEKYEISQTQPVSSYTSSAGTTTGLRPGYLVAYTRSLMPILMNSGDDKSKDKKGIQPS